FVDPIQMPSVAIDLERGWLRSRWFQNSMYFEKVDLFATDHVVGSFMITSDPAQVRRLLDAIPDSSKTVRNFRWGEGFLTQAAPSDEVRVNGLHDSPAFTIVLVPAYGIQIATQRTDLLDEIVEIRMNNQK
ncbi:MAG: hypothetical protein ACK5QH_08595, partial [Rubrivivax sp.]